MPELPEVETTVRGLKEKVLLRAFLDVWTDTPKIIKKPESFKEFKNKIKNKEIKKIWRRGKNIIFELSDNFFMLVHQKMTGHLLYGLWAFKQEKWIPKIKGPLQDKMNSYIRLLFFLDNGKMIALSDLRKFAKVELLTKKGLEEELKKIGPEPLEKDFTFEKFEDIFKNKKGLPSHKATARQGKIKQVLMNQEVIAGIGNIYSDEILWQAKINPLKDVSELSVKELKTIYRSIKEILAKAIKLRGTSVSDYRDVEGRSGSYGRVRKVYQKEGEKCSRCQTTIKRVKIGGRSAHFCPTCQK